MGFKHYKYKAKSTRHLYKPKIIKTQNNPTLYNVLDLAPFEDQFDGLVHKNFYSVDMSDVSAVENGESKTGRVRKFITNNQLKCLRIFAFLPSLYIAYSAFKGYVYMEDAAKIKNDIKLKSDI